MELSTANIGSLIQYNRNERRNALLIVNPKAGNTRSMSFVAPTIEAMTNVGYAVTAFTTTCCGDATRLTCQYGRDVDIIVASGGDGTVNEVICGLMTIEKARRPVLGYLPSGSTNDYATALRIPKRQDQMIDALINGRAIDVDAGCFNGRYYAYLASFGAFTDISYSTSQSAKNALGFLAYLGGGMASVGNIRPIHTSVVINGELLEDDFAFVAVSNTRSVAGLINYNDAEIDLNDGLFEIILITYPETALALGKIVRALTSADFDCEYIRRFTSSEARFILDSPVAWTLDGEYAEGGHEVIISNIHSAIKIKVPDNNSLVRL